MKPFRITPGLLLSGALAIAIVSLLGSLYFSEIAGYAPCTLCWYQRITMYPLVVILTIGMIRHDAKHVHWYAIPLAWIGFCVAIYHNIIYYLANFTTQKVITQCSLNGTSCTSRYIEWLGFITIPLLSLVAFTAIIVLMFWHRHLVKGK